MRSSLSKQHFKVVNSFNSLIESKFSANANAICWDRDLAGDFEEIVNELNLEENITEVSKADLLALTLTESGKTARNIIIEDLKLLTNYGASPSLNLLKCYERDNELEFISTDVYSYHVDRSPIATDTFLCTYFGAASDFLPNEQVVQKILIPEVREKLKALHNGPESEFEYFLKEYFFDLHYQAKPSAKPINLGIGKLWKLAVDYPNQTVLPCVHRAPKENVGEYRLLLIC